MLRAQYLENGWRQRLGDNGPPIGNGHLGISWSRDRWRHVIHKGQVKGQGRDPNMFDVQYLKNGCRYWLGDNRAPIINRYMGMKWSCDWWRHVTLKGQGGDPVMFDAHYVENGWRYRLGCNGVPLENGVWWVEWSGARCRCVCRSCYLVLITYCHSTFIIDKIAWKYRKTANIIEKKLQFITLLTQSCIVSHIENSKNDKGYITKQHVDILTRCSK